MNDFIDEYSFTFSKEKKKTRNGASRLDARVVMSHPTVGFLPQSAESEPTPARPGERLEPREHLALQEFERRATPRRHVRDCASVAVFPARRGRVSAADNGEGALARGVRHRLNAPLRSLFESSHLKDALRSVVHDSFGVLNHV